MPHPLHTIYRAARFAAIAVAALTSGQAIADDAVLLASTVPGYVPGMVVAFSDRLNVPEGASATLLFQSGGMLRLRGPFEGTLGQQQSKESESNVAMLADLFRLGGIDATVIGGTRSTNARARSAVAVDDIHVDPQRSGTYCFEPATSVWIGRPAGDAGNYTVRRKGSSRTIAWTEGSTRVEWPADVPIEDGSQFEIAAGNAARTTVTFKAIPADLPPGPATVAKGILLGCHDQFDDELRRVSRSIAGPELWMTTDRGRQPTYKTGDPIALTVVAATDGYLYCIATGSTGAVPIFPGNVIDGAQLRGSAPLSIPGNRQPAGLTADPGIDQVRCWLADRDITPELPHALIKTQTARLPDQLSGDLDALFSHIGGTRIASDVVTVRTE
ncbi:MAG: hypothetical protein QOG73_1230 [Acetobacteraceae bacterium]|nr:hypothetical protein [Acetobacteraceae bacterium]